VSAVSVEGQCLRDPDAASQTKNEAMTWSGRFVATLLEEEVIIGICLERA